MSKLRFLKSLSLADQKVETTPQWKLELRFLKSVSLADQTVEHPDQKAATPKGRYTLIKRQRHPNLGFWSQCVTCWSNGGDNSPSESWNLGFWSQCHLLIKQWNTLIKKLQHPKWRHPDQKAETPKLRFLQSVCHLLIKMRQPLPVKKTKGQCHLQIRRCRHPNIGFWCHCHLPKGGDNPASESWNLGFWSQCHLLIKRQRHPDQKDCRDTLIKR